MPTAWITLGVFVVCYAFFAAWPTRRSWVAAGGAVALMLSGAIGWREGLLHHINWNVMGLFVGTLVLADLFMQSRMPAVMAEWMIDKTRTARGAMLAVCALSSALSMFVENVAVVLLIAPVALSLARKIKANPTGLIVGIAVCSNLQGTATLIGDPPSMILAGYLKLSFNDFFVYQGRPGIFFAVQVGMLASLAVLAWLFRGRRDRASNLEVERARSWFPSGLLIVFVLGLATTSRFDPGFRWLAGTWTLLLAAIGLIWHRAVGWGKTVPFVRTLDWDTTVFLAGVFVIVGALSESGWLDRFAAVIGPATGGRPIVAFILITASAVAFSAFVDNVPFLLAMIPVTQQVADGMSVPVPLLMFGLLIGACLGGNITPIGASANVVAVGILRREGQPVSFPAFMRIGVPFTLAAVLASALFVWWIWSPATFSCASR